MISNARAESDAVSSGRGGGGGTDGKLLASTAPTAEYDDDGDGKRDSSASEDDLGELRRCRSGHMKRGSVRPPRPGRRVCNDAALPFSIHTTFSNGLCMFSVRPRRARSTAILIYYCY